MTLLWNLCAAKALVRSELFDSSAVLLGPGVLAYSLRFSWFVGVCAVPSCESVIRPCCCALNVRVTPATCTGRQHMVSRKRYVELLSAEEIMSLVVSLGKQLQDSLQRRSTRAAERKVYADDYDDEQLEAEEAKDAQEDEICYHVRGVERLQGLR